MERLNEDELIRDYLEGISKEDLLAKHGVTRSHLNSVRKKHNIAVWRNAVARYRKNIEAVGTVTCQICGLHFQSLSSHVKAHGLTVDEYVACYDHVLNTAAVKEKMSASAKRKFDLRPELREVLREVGRQNIKKVNAEGKGWRTPK